MATLFAATIPVAVIMLRRKSSDTTGTIKVLVPARAMGLRDALRLRSILLGLSGRVETSLVAGRPALRIFAFRACAAGTNTYTYPLHSPDPEISWHACSAHHSKPAATDHATTST